MEKVYYKGKIGKLSDLENVKINLGDFEHYGIAAESDEFLDFLNTLNTDDRRDFIQKIKNGDSNVVTIGNIIFEELKKYINRIYNESHNYKQEIIFEIITTTNGDLYGKELHTGLLFPIAKKINGKISSSCKKNAVVRGNEIFFVITNFTDYYYDGKDYYIDNYKSEKIKVWYAGISKLFKSYYYDISYLPINSLNIYTLTPIVNCFENLSLCENIIFSSEVANNNEIESYLNMFQGFMKNRKKNNFIKKITTEYNKNVFNSKIEVQESIKKVKKEKFEKDQITLKLENIEYLLMLLKQKNKEMYDEVYKEYNEMINSESDVLTLTPISIQSLITLEGKIEFYLNYSKNTTNNIFDYLSNLKNEYLNNFQNNDGEITKLTLKDIDNLYENFLKVKSEYLVKAQLQILKDIAFLYVMEIK